MFTIAIDTICHCSFMDKRFIIFRYYFRLSSVRFCYLFQIKRPYFHIKALDKRQLKNWTEYLDLEIKEGDPHRIIMCFERCLVACAQYEEVWCRYAQYMEEHVEKVKAGQYASEDITLDDTTVNSDKCDAVKDCNSALDNTINSHAVEGDCGEAGTGASSSACTGLTSTSQDSNNKCTDNTNDDKDESGNSNVVVDASDEQCESSKNILEDKCKEQSSDKDSINASDDVLLVKIKSEPVDDEEDVVCINDANTTINSNQLAESASVALLKSGRGCWTYDDVRAYVGTGVGLVGRVLACPPLTKKWVMQLADWEDVRQVYRRGAWIHCPNKPLVSMQWAHFEESQGESRGPSAPLNVCVSAPLNVRVSAPLNVCVCAPQCVCLRPSMCVSALI